METMAIAMLILHILFWGFIVIALIYLIARRINLKDQEDFEKRDN